MKRLFIFVALTIMAASCKSSGPVGGELVGISRYDLQNKIKGGWAGQCIGCSYGIPFEFKWTSMIHDSVPIDWDENSIDKFFPDDDLYMDITFVDVYERLGIDAPVDSLALAFAHADYALMHANQAARYNILRGIMPPLSGSPLYNIHADDIDFQIESDHCGLMAPGLPAEALKYAGKVGHIICAGDGFYSGAFFSVMYSLAFICDDIDYIVSEALKVIPRESKLYKAMRDVIDCHRANPDNWELAWALLNRKYGDDLACPECVLSPLNIDALLNCGYVVIGLLYGRKDFEKTMEIALRCGQDTDCNAASAAGIIGTLIGYDAIPEKFTAALDNASDRCFSFTDYSFNRVWQVSLSQALKVLESAGATADAESISFVYRKAPVLPLEVNYTNLSPYKKTVSNQSIVKNNKYYFDGTGISAKYYTSKDGVLYHWAEEPSYVAEFEVWVDGKFDRTVSIPDTFHDRTDEIYFKFGLPYGRHELEFRYLNPESGRDFFLDAVTLYR